MVDKNKFIKLKKQKAEYIINNDTKNLTKDQKKILDEIYIPPAYKYIFLNKNPNDKIHIIAIDSKKRYQYFYNDKYKKNSENRKYKSLKSLIKHIKKIENNNKKNISLIVNKLKNNKSLSNTDLIHIIIRLLILTNCRIGSKKYETLYNSTGLTTLKYKHIINNKTDKNIKLSFIGKKGKLNESIISDNDIIYILNKLCKLNESNEYIFLKKDNKFISTQDIKNYFKKQYNEEISPKMFRTYYANYHMIDYINKLNLNTIHPNFDKKTEKQKHSLLKKNILNYVSSKLNNTANISFKKYINHKLYFNLIDNIIKNKFNKIKNIHSYLKQKL